VPLIVAGAALIMALLTRMPVLVWLGAALLGWVAGEVIATDPAIMPLLHSAFGGAFGANLDSVMASLGSGIRFTNNGPGGEILCGLIGIFVVLAIGALWRRRSMAGHAEQAA
jgi:predicted tellurium resistance membrane protein TerC